MSMLIVDAQKCKTCGICTQSCPTSVISHGTAGVLPVIDADKEGRCIYCGHCESVCPEEALVHRLSQEAGAVFSTPELTPDPEAIGRHFRSRRSIRQYQAKPVDRSTITKVMDVVRYAPTGTNRQLNKWVVVTDTGLIAQLAAGTIAWMKAAAKAQPEMATRYNIPALIEGFEKGHDRICRKAPCLFICCTPSDHPIGAKDAIIAASHLELLLPAYGIGACWAGYLMMAFQHYPDLKKLVGLDDTYTVHAVLMAGYPRNRYRKIPRRNPSDITWL